MGETAKSESMTKLVSMLDALHAGQVKLQQSFTKMLESLAKPASRPQGAAHGDGVCFPNYGRSRGLPVTGAAKSDLDFYRRGCERTLSDPEKARFHERERMLLAAILAELGEAPSDAPPADDGPPPADSDVPF